jgi:23S rRNA pseudouridine1911/1915/1917 synthase
MPDFIVDSRQHGQRLDLALSQTLPVTRSQIQKAVRSGAITVNRASAKPHAPVKTGDVIFFPDSLLSQASPAKVIPVVDVLYEDSDVLVVDKPSGLLVHPTAAGGAAPTLVDFLLEHCPAIKSVGEDPLRPGLVHRLDREVSGVLIVAKTPAAFTELKKQFHDRSVAKEYLALVYGHLPKDHGTIDLPIARSAASGRMVARPVSQAGKESRTEYEVEARFKNATYVRVSPKTGRTNQIRVHFFAIDHPLVGDRLYAKKRMPHIHAIDLKRIFLHAHQLTVTLLNGEKRTFTAPLPAPLIELLNRLPKK